jgi:hypothetical protein
VPDAAGSHLWEIDHDFYGPEAPFFGRPQDYMPYIHHHDSWQHFLDNGISDAPMGLNLLYRWDFHAWHLSEDAEPGEPERFELALFWLMPRKGIMARSNITVTPADEPAIIEWLRPHAKYMQEMWAPLLPLSLDTIPKEV